MYYTSHYKIDFEKVKTTEDVIRILKALDIAFEHNCLGVETIKDLLKEEPKNSTTIEMSNNTNPIDITR